MEAHVGIYLQKSPMSQQTKPQSDHNRENLKINTHCLGPLTSSTRIKLAINES
jgi:hypothetical protein